MSTKIFVLLARRVLFGVSAALYQTWCEGEILAAWLGLAIPLVFLVCACTCCAFILEKEGERRDSTGKDLPLDPEGTNDDDNLKRTAALEAKVAANEAKVAELSDLVGELRNALLKQKAPQEDTQGQQSFRRRCSLHTSRLNWRLVSPDTPIQTTKGAQQKQAKKVPPSQIRSDRF